MWKVNVPALLEVQLSERCSSQDGLMLDLNLNYSWKSVKVLTTSENTISGIVCFEFSCEQVVHSNLRCLFEQCLVALIILSTPFYLLEKNNLRWRFWEGAGN